MTDEEIIKTLNKNNYILSNEGIKMKIYIVTAGDCDGYMICRVFINKKKAEEYINLHQENWDNPRIEEYDTWDNNINIQ